MAFDRWISQESERFETALPRTESEPANLIANSVLDNIGGGWGGSDIEFEQFRLKHTTRSPREVSIKR